jgi:hypothetical protein
LTIEKNVISNSNSLSIEPNLNINDTYNLINDIFNIIDFGKNDTSNFEVVPLSSERQSRRRGRGNMQTKTLKKINNLN